MQFHQLSAFFNFEVRRCLGEGFLSDVAAVEEDSSGLTSLVSNTSGEESGNICPEIADGRDEESRPILSNA